MTLFNFPFEVTWRKLLATLLTLYSSRVILEPAWSLCSSLSHLKSSTSSSEHLQHYSRRYGQSLLYPGQTECPLSLGQGYLSSYKWQAKVFLRKPCNNVLHFTMFILAFFPGPSAAASNVYYSWGGA